MGYDAATGDALGALLTVAAEGSGVWVEFTWSGERRHDSPVDSTDEAALTTLVREFAVGVEGTLKEQRGLSGNPLPWDNTTPR